MLLGTLPILVVIACLQPSFLQNFTTDGSDIFTDAASMLRKPNPGKCMFAIRRALRAPAECASARTDHSSYALINTLIIPTVHFLHSRVRIAIHAGDYDLSSDDVDHCDRKLEKSLLQCVIHQSSADCDVLTFPGSIFALPPRDMEAWARASEDAPPRDSSFHPPSVISLPIAIPVPEFKVDKPILTSDTSPGWTAKERQTVDSDLTDPAAHPRTLEELRDRVSSPS